MKDHTKTSLGTGTTIGVSCSALQPDFILDQFATAYCIDATNFIPTGYCFSSSKYDCPFFEVEETSINDGTIYRGI